MLRGLSSILTHSLCHFLGGTFSKSLKHVVPQLSHRHDGDVNNSTHFGGTLQVVQCPHTEPGTEKAL